MSPFPFAPYSTTINNIYDQGLLPVSLLLNKMNYVKHKWTAAFMKYFQQQG
jgi:hypothetical protein